MIAKDKGYRIETHYPQLTYMKGSSITFLMANPKRSRGNQNDARYIIFR